MMPKCVAPAPRLLLSARRAPHAACPTCRAPPLDGTECIFLRASVTPPAWQTATLVHGTWQAEAVGQAERLAPGSLARFAVSSLLPGGHEAWLKSCPLAAASWLHVQLPADWQENSTIALNISRPHKPDALAQACASCPLPARLCCKARAYAACLLCVMMLAVNSALFAVHVVCLALLAGRARSALPPAPAPESTLFVCARSLRCSFVHALSDAAVPEVHACA